MGGTHVCLRKVDPALIFRLIRRHGVTHLCGAPVVLTALIHAPEEVKIRPDHVVEVATGGAAPPSAVIGAMEAMGFRVTHLYGLTESYGPATICAWQPEWDGLPLPERAVHAARQGVAYPTLDGLMVADPATLAPVPRDGATLGEVMLRGNTVMKGYLRNPTATEEALRGGWFHTGDLAVWHPDGYIEIKDRSKDVIISGGENVSSLEVEEVLYRHPAVMEAAVVAKPDPGGARRRAPSLPCARGRRPLRPMPSSPGAGSTSRTSRRRGPSCSDRSRRPRPGKSRSTSCASRRKRWIDMNIASILARKGGKVVTCRPEQSIRQALSLLAEHNIGALVVVDETGVPAGMLSERDIVREAARDERLFGRTVGEIMTRDVIVGVPEDDLRAVRHTMTERRIRHVPVIADGAAGRHRLDRGRRQGRARPVPRRGGHAADAGRGQALNPTSGRGRLDCMEAA